MITRLLSHIRTPGQIFRLAFTPAADYQLAGWLFLKLLALIYLAAFYSIAIQITGLAGDNGILPFSELLERVFEQHGYSGFFYVPSLFWLNSSDLMLQAVAYGGCLLSVLLFFGVRRQQSLIALFLCYLSLFHAGQDFLTFQWDTLLLEAGFLAIFLNFGPNGGPNHLLVFLYHWLLFRLRFMSGVSKLASGDPVWANLTTLNYYFETQPLPHVGAWYFHQLPDMVLKAGVVFTFFTELIVPFFIFLPRPFRLFAAAITIIMQLLIIASSNHNWINLLTIVLCLFLLDDALLKKILPRWLHNKTLASNTANDTAIENVSVTHKPAIIRNILLSIAAITIISSSASLFFYRELQVNVPSQLIKATAFVRAWGIGHIFHVFPTMQTERQELQIEGSYDGKHWQTYQFKYKPGPLDQAPRFNIPHQPRLDWMIWFVPPQHPRFAHFFNRFIESLYQGSPEVLALLEYNPFQQGPPKFIRVRVFKYNFTNFEERQQTGNWWKSQYLGLFPNVKPRIP